MDTLGIEPRAFRMRTGCDTTTPCALGNVTSRQRSPSLRSFVRQDFDERAGERLDAWYRSCVDWGVGRIACPGSLRVALHSLDRKKLPDVKWESHGLVWGREVAANP